MDRLPLSFYRLLCEKCVGDLYQVVSFQLRYPSWYDVLSTRTVRECDQSAEAWATLQYVLPSRGKRKCEQVFQEFRKRHMPSQEVCRVLTQRRRLMDARIERARFLACLLIDTLSDRPHTLCGNVPLSSFASAYIVLRHETGILLTLHVTADGDWMLRRADSGAPLEPVYTIRRRTTSSSQRCAFLRFMLHRCALEDVVRSPPCGRDALSRSADMDEDETDENDGVAILHAVACATNTQFAAYLQRMRQCVCATTFLEWSQRPNGQTQFAFLW